LSISRGEPGDKFTLYNDSQQQERLDDVAVSVVHPTADLSVSHASGEPSDIGCVIDPGPGDPRNLDVCSVTIDWNTYNSHPEEDPSLWAEHSVSGNQNELSGSPSGSMIFDVSRTGDQRDVAVGDTPIHVRKGLDESGRTGATAA